MAFIIIRYLFKLVRPTSAPTQGQMTNTLAAHQIKNTRSQSLWCDVCVCETFLFVRGTLYAFQVGSLIFIIHCDDKRLPPCPGTTNLAARSLTGLASPDYIYALSWAITFCFLSCMSKSQPWAAQHSGQDPGCGLWKVSSCGNGIRRSSFAVEKYEPERKKCCFSQGWRVIGFTEFSEIESRRAIFDQHGAQVKWELKIKEKSSPESYKLVLILSHIFKIYIKYFGYLSIYCNNNNKNTKRVDFLSLLKEWNMYNHINYNHFLWQKTKQ